MVALYLAWLKQRGKKPRSINDATNVFDLHVLPEIGNMAVADVRRADVVRIVRKLEAAGLARTGGKVVQYLRAAFTRAELDEAPWHEMRAPGTNPCRKLEVQLGVRRKRRLSIEEVRSLGMTLRAASARGESPWLIGLIFLWLLTGARHAEIRTARREWIDWQLGKIDLPDSKTGEKVIWLSPAAMQVVAAIPELEGNPYLICGTKPGRPMFNPYRGWRRLMKEAGIEGATPHDLRRTFASMGLGRGLTLEQIGALLGHSDVETTKSYSFLDEAPAQQAARLVGEGIRQLLDAPRQGELFKGQRPDG
jgi:integrase